MRKIKCSSLMKNLDAKVVRATKRVASKVGLTTIEEDVYSLIKLGAKRKSSMGYPDAFLVLRNARVMYVGNGDYAWLYAVGITEWFKTSPVQSVKADGKNYLIETENSLYKLERQ